MTKISAVSFANCTNLKSIEWPEMLTQIDERAFEYCNFIRSKSLTR
ncbi:MAG: leucine-rich repeat protein [Eubacterium sp.]